MIALRPLPPATDYGRAAWWRTDAELAVFAGADFDAGAMSTAELEQLVYGGAPVRGGASDGARTSRAAASEPEA